MAPIPSLEEYVESLGHLTAAINPTLETAETIAIKEAAFSLAALPDISTDSLSDWAAQHPRWVPVLGLAAGLSQEKLKNLLTHHFGTAGWVTLARYRSSELIQVLDEQNDLVRLLTVQLEMQFGFGDVLIARAGSRVIATKAGNSGRDVEDEIEAIAKDLGLPYELRSRFVGRGGRSAPCDLVVPSAANPMIVVAAKGFDSTGSKLTDAVREIEEMAEVRLPQHYVMAVVDGIGWKSRMSDLRRIYQFWTDQSINGMYTLASLDRFRADIEAAAKLRGLLPS